MSEQTNPLHLLSEEAFIENIGGLKDGLSSELKTVSSILSTIAAGSGEVSANSFGEVKNLVRLGLHRKIPVEDSFVAERETALAISVGDSTGITAATVDEDAFIAAVGTAHSGVYEAVYDGAVWHKEDNEAISLAAYGITVTGTPAEGDKVVITETASRIILDVADHDVNCADNEQSIMFISRDVIAYGTIPFSAPQLMIYALAELPAGKYKFTLNHADNGGGVLQNGTYMFTTTQAIPAGGGIRHSKVGEWSQNAHTKAEITAGKITTYGIQPQRTVIESNIVVSEWDGETVCTDLGTVAARDKQYIVEVENLTKVNFSERQIYGSNRYAHSCYRKWLNSTGKAVKSGDTTFSYWWTPSDIFDMPPSAAARQMAGFLHGLDPDLADNIGEATIVVEIPSPDRVSGDDTTETLNDKVFLMSKTEVYGGNNISGKEGELLEIFSGTSNSDKIKYQNGTARYWWLRSARPSFAHYVRCVSASGELYDINAGSTNGVVCGLLIKSRKSDE